MISAFIFSVNFLDRSHAMSMLIFRHLIFIIEFYCVHGAWTSTTVRRKKHYRNDSTDKNVVVSMTQTWAETVGCRGSLCLSHGKSLNGGAQFNHKWAHKFQIWNEMVTHSLTSRQIKWHHHHHPIAFLSTKFEMNEKQTREMTKLLSIGTRSNFNYHSSLNNFRFYCYNVGLSVKTCVRASIHRQASDRATRDDVWHIVEAQISDDGMSMCLCKKCNKRRRATTNWIIKKEREKNGKHTNKIETTLFGA